jgi:CheY-like chemotaxis protein
MEIHLLIAEDDEEDQMFIQRAFNKINFEGNLHFVNNGEEVLTYLHSCKKTNTHPVSNCPNILLLDLNMPKLNGWETLEMLKSDPDWVNLPVIIFTTSKSEDDIEASYRSGAACFIAKPDSYLGYVDTFRNFNHFWADTVQLPK